MMMVAGVRGERAPARSRARLPAGASHLTAIAEREGLDVVAELAGHADVRTSKRYVTVTASRTQTAIDHAFGSGIFAGGWG